MLPKNFEQKTADLGKPAGWADEDCMSLPVAQTHYLNEAGNKVPCIISLWQPNKEDIEAINNGHGIWLTITGNGMPPVSLQTENPFANAI